MADPPILSRIPDAMIISVYSIGLSIHQQWIALILK